MKALLVTLVMLMSVGGAFAAEDSPKASMHPLPDTMLAAAADRGGGPEVLSPHFLPVPKPGAAEVLIAVHAAGVAAWDMPIPENPGPRARFPLVSGSEGAGVIAALGSGVRDFKLGDKVYGMRGRTGFHAGYVAVPAERIARIPKGISMTEAGALAVSGLSALQGIDDVLQMRRGETLIIHGASGGVGTIAIQLARLREVKVLATATSEEGLALLRRLGADVVVNGRTDDIVAAAQRLSANGVDAVLGLAGGDALERCIDALRRDGRGRVAYLFGMEPLPKPRFGLRMTLYSLKAGTREFEQLNRAADAAKLSVPVAAEYPLENASEAYRRLEARNVLGKIVLRVH